MITFLFYEPSPPGVEPFLLCERASLPPQSLSKICVANYYFNKEKFYYSKRFKEIIHGTIFCRSGVFCLIVLIISYLVGLLSIIFTVYGFVSSFEKCRKLLF